MAREYAQIRLGIWQDDDWRDLTPDQQHLYLVLVTHPTLSHCGVADWRPRRIAAFSAGWTAESVQAAAAVLVERRFLVVDEDTEEVAIRSFVRHDGLMKQPNMAAAMCSAWAAVASRKIRSTIAGEVRRLRVEEPELACWEGKSSRDLLASMLRSTPPGDDPEPPATSSVNPSGNPSGNPSVDPSGNPSVKGLPNPTGNPSPTPAPAPAPSSNSPSVRGWGLQGEGDDDASQPPAAPPRPQASARPRTDRATRLPDGWRPSAAVHAQLVAEIGDGRPASWWAAEHRKFTDHWRAQGGVRGRKVDWDATWRNWIRRAAEDHAPRRAEAPRAGSGVWDNVINIGGETA